MDLIAGFVTAAANSSLSRPRAEEPTEAIAQAGVSRHAAALSFETRRHSASKTRANALTATLLRTRRAGALRRVAGHACDLGEFPRDRALGCFDVEAILQIEPELRRGAERLAQTQRRIGRNARRLGGDALDARARDPHGFRQRAGRESERTQELFAQNFAGVEGRELLGHGFSHGSHRETAARRKQQ